MLNAPLASVVVVMVFWPEEDAVMVTPEGAGADVKLLDV
jgi:hypothetical protein